MVTSFIFGLITLLTIGAPNKKNVLLASLQSEREMKKEKHRNRVRKRAMKSKRKREKAKREHESDPGACQRPISKRQCSFAAQVRTLQTTRAENEWRSRGVKEPGEMNPLSRPSSPHVHLKERSRPRRGGEGGKAGKMGTSGWMSDLSHHTLLLVAPRSGIYTPMVVRETKIDDIIAGKQWSRGRENH